MEKSSNSHHGVSSLATGAEWSKKLCSDLYKLLENNLFTDVTLRGSDDVNLRAHSCVLAAASPVMTELLQNGSELWIDVSSSVLHSLLKLVYCGIIEANDPALHKMLKVADDFQIVKRGTVVNLSSAGEFKNTSSSESRMAQLSDISDMVKSDDADLEREGSVTDSENLEYLPASAMSYESMTENCPEQDPDSLLSTCQPNTLSTTEESQMQDEHILQPSLIDQQAADEIITLTECSKPCEARLIATAASVSQELVADLNNFVVLDEDTQGGSSDISGALDSKTVGSKTKAGKARTRRQKAKKKRSQCDICGKTFHKQSALVRHNNAIHLKLEYKCQQCDFVSNFKYCLSHHVRKSHSGETFFKHQCECCGSRFLRQHELRDHYTKEHVSYENWPHQCEHCNKRFPSLKKLRSHRVSHNPKNASRKELVPCPDCGKEFGKTLVMEKHRHIVHLQDTTCACEYCGKQFRHPTNLQHHMERHTTSKDFVCGICGASFILRDYLRKHEHTHTRPKEFQCRHCNKSFLRKTALLQHERIHTKEKPLCCNICGKTFRFNANVSAHKRNKHPVEYQLEKQIPVNQVTMVTYEEV